MTKDLRVTIVQSDIVWEDIDANLSAYSKKLEKIESSSTELIVLPEMFNTGFTMNAHAVAEHMNEKTMEWMAKTASQKNCVVTGSMVIMVHGGKYFNRLIWMRPDGTYEFYNKRHTFRMAEENKTYSSGDRKLIIELAGWRICPLVCYDLRFPVWSRNTPQTSRSESGSSKRALNNTTYDCLIYVANWPERRSYAWRHLLIARAIENQTYVVGVNRIGKDGKEVEYTGYSVVLNPKGEPICKTKPKEESIETITLSYKELENYRDEFPVSFDADKFRIE